MASLSAYLLIFSVFKGGVLLRFITENVLCKRFAEDPVVSTPPHLELTVLQLIILPIQLLKLKLRILNLLLEVDYLLFGNLFSTALEELLLEEVIRFLLEGWGFLKYLIKSLV